MEFTIQKIAENIWAIEQKGVRAFLLVGQDNAILVDTCFGGDILAVCQSITNNPITLITTHSDPDHIGCDQQFPMQYLHSAEFERYESRGKGAPHATPMQEGDVFEVGEYRLEVILIPGHTPGSIALLEQMRLDGLFDTVFPSHGEAIVTADILGDHLALADDVLSGSAVPVGPAPDWFPDTVKIYRHGRAQMYYAYD